MVALCYGAITSFDQIDLTGFRHLRRSMSGQEKIKELETEQCITNMQRSLSKGRYSNWSVSKLFMSQPIGLWNILSTIKDVGVMKLLVCFLTVTNFRQFMAHNSSSPAFKLETGCSHHVLYGRKWLGH